VKVAVLVAGAVPNPEQSGSTLTVWTIVRHLIEAGHEATVFVLRDEALGAPGAIFAERADRLRGLGAEVRVLESQAGQVFGRMSTSTTARLRRARRPSDEEMLPQLLDAELVRSAVEEAAPDVLYAFHWEAVAASRGLRGVIPRFATVVDLPQLAAWYRWRATPGRLRRAGLLRLLWLQSRLRHMPRLLVRLLNECEASGNFAAHHAAWLRRRGATRCDYYPTPIEDLAGDGWRAARRQHPRGGLPRLLLIGHLRGISTLDGLDVTATSILPRLERTLGADGLEVRIVGDYDPPARLRAALDRPSVSFLGHVERVDAEFAAADVLLVPTSIPLGARVRIITGFSFGCPVVAHESNRLGIPELADGGNILLGRNGEELGEAAGRVFTDLELQDRLAEAGRATYERVFAPSAAGVRLEATLERIATDG
jgi:glycosyltransferase involved in cell wall biosynthesis